MGAYDISQKLLAIMEDVKNGPWNRLAVVYDTQVPDGTSYPYATLSSGDITEEVLDTDLNQTLYRFTIRAVNVAKDKADVEATMRKLADDFLAELRKRENQTLDGTVDRFLPYTLSWWYENVNSVPTRYFEIQMDILEHFSIS